MHTTNIAPVILCGGSGTRLWPLSRMGFPKQFLCLTGKESLFQQATLRLANLSSTNITVSNPIIVTGEDHRFLATEQLREIGIELECALLEPAGRNTAPALTLAAVSLLDRGIDPVMVVTPADQSVLNTSNFTSAMNHAVAEAANGTIVILGVTPDRPESGYGYIKTENSLNATTLTVEKFIEKPNPVTAQTFLNEGGYYWNAGMFVLKASVWLKALQKFRSDIAETSFRAWSKRSTDGVFIRPGQAEFMAIPSESIDYAVIECCSNDSFPLKMVPLDADWDDLGAWDSVWNAYPKDNNGNAHHGDVMCTESHNTLVHATSRLVSLVGVDNLIVIETPDAILVANKSHSQNVKHIVNELNTRGREEHTLHRKVHRPWGWYDSIDEGERFKVKRIQVKPKASLSLQKHYHRAEHWVVVTGTAEITNGDKVIILTENQSTYIPLGEVHRLSNPGSIPLEIIEIQSGSYLNEDDIIRIEDTYGRAGID